MTLGYFGAGGSGGVGVSFLSSDSKGLPLEEWTAVLRWMWWLVGCEAEGRSVRGVRCEVCSHLVERVGPFCLTSRRWDGMNPVTGDKTSSTAKINIGKDEVKMEEDCELEIQEKGIVHSNEGLEPAILIACYQLIQNYSQ